VSKYDISEVSICWCIRLSPGNPWKLPHNQPNNYQFHRDQLDTHIKVNVSVQNLTTRKYRVRDTVLIAAIARVLSRVPLVILYCVYLLTQVSNTSCWLELGSM